MKETIKHLAENNTYQYNLLKAAEECQELALILIQKLSKGASDKAIIEEIGDVKMRVKVLEQMFDKDKIQERLEYKVGKCQQYIEEGKYKGGV